MRPERRQIGYVIQQIGLFPHQTIAGNIATVPKMLDWEKPRIADRIDVETPPPPYALWTPPDWDKIVPHRAPTVSHE